MRNTASAPQKYSYQRHPLSLWDGVKTNRPKYALTHTRYIILRACPQELDKEAATTFAASRIADGVKEWLRLSWYKNEEERHATVMPVQ